MGRRHALGIALGLALAIGLGLARLASNSIPAPTPPPDVGASLFLFQTNPPALASQCTGSAVTSADGGTITFTRATVGSCTKSDGTVVDLTSGQPALQGDGLLLETAGGTNSKNTDDFSAWNVDNATITSNSTTAPDGTLTADTLTDNSTNSFHRTYISATTAGAGIYVFTLYAKAGTAHFIRLLGGNIFDATFDVSLGIITTNLGSNATIEPAANGFYRLSIGKSDTAPSFIQVYMGRTALEAGGSYSGTGDTVILWRGNTKSSSVTPYPDSSVKAVASNVTRNATTATITNPLGNSDTTWTVRMRAAPNSNLWTKGEAKQGLFLIGSTLAAADTADAYVNSSGKLVFEVVDHASGVRTWTSSLALSSWQHDLRVQSAAGTLTAYDGVDTLAGTTSGAGTGQITTMPATAYLGSLGSGSQLDGRVMDVCINNAANTCLSLAAQRLAFAASDAGLYVNPFGPQEPEWCVRDTFKANGEIAGAGTAGSANSWVLYADAGMLVSRTWDSYSGEKSRATTAIFSGNSTARLCNNRGEQFIYVDDKPAQIYLPNAVDGGTSTGTFYNQPSTIRVSSAGCLSRSSTVCGTRAHYLAALGDSLTATGTLSNPWPSQLDDLLPSTWGTYNYAVGGSIVTQMRDRWQVLAKQTHAWDYVSINCCINDQLAAGTAASVTWPILEPLIRDIEAVGATPILIIPSPAKWAATITWTQPHQDQYELMRTNLLNDCADAGRTCIDTYVAFGGGDGGDPAVLKEIWNVAILDRVHINDAGHAYEADAGYHAMGF